MNSRTRILAALLAALISTIGMASVALAQDNCYPVPVDGCDEPTGPDTGVLPDTTPKQPDAPAGPVAAAGQSPVVLAQTELAQTGVPAATLLGVVALTLASGMALLLTTRRRRS